jgi:hypothetical protein
MGVIPGMYAGKLDEQGPEELPGRVKVEDEGALDGRVWTAGAQGAEGAGRERLGGSKKGAVHHQGALDHYQRPLVF